MRWQTKKLKSTFDKLKSADLFITFQPEATYLIRELMNIDTPLISMLHSYPLIYTDRPIFKVLKPAMERSNAIQVLMPEYIDIAKSRLNNVKIVYIPNVVPQYNECAELKNKIIICVARVDPEKHPELLLEAFNQIKNKYPDWKVEWWGENGRYHCVQNLKKKIKEYGLTNRFLLCGTTEDVEEKLLKSSIFAFPSSFEGFSLALTEAMSLGLPVIGRKDCPSVNSLIKNQINGMLVDPNVQDLASALEYLICNENKRIAYGHKAKDDMKSFSSDAVYSRWMELINSVLN